MTYYNMIFFPKSNQQQTSFIKSIQWCRDARKTKKIQQKMNIYIYIYIRERERERERERDNIFCLGKIYIEWERVTNL